MLRMYCIGALVFTKCYACTVLGPLYFMLVLLKLLSNLQNAVIKKLGIHVPHWSYSEVLFKASPIGQYIIHNICA